MTAYMRKRRLVELKVITDEEPLKLPEIDRKQQELEAWKTLAIARGTMLDPLNFPGSRSYAIATINAREALRILKDLNAG